MNSERTHTEEDVKYTQNAADIDPKKCCLTYPWNRFSDLCDCGFFIIDEKDIIWEMADEIIEQIITRTPYNVKYLKLCAELHNPDFFARCSLPFYANIFKISNISKYNSKQNITLIFFYTLFAKLLVDQYSYFECDKDILLQEYGDCVGGIFHIEKEEKFLPYFYLESHNEYFQVVNDFLSKPLGNILDRAKLKNDGFQYDVSKAPDESIAYPSNAHRRIHKILYRFYTRLQEINIKPPALLEYLHYISNIRAKFFADTDLDHRISFDINVLLANDEILTQIKNFFNQLYRFSKSHKAKEKAELLKLTPTNEWGGYSHQVIQRDSRELKNSLNEWQKSLNTYNKFFTLHHQSLHTTHIDRILSIDSSFETKKYILELLQDEEKDFPFSYTIKRLERVLYYSCFFLLEKPWKNEKLWWNFKIKIESSKRLKFTVPEIFFENLNILQNCKRGLIDWQGYNYTMRAYKSHCEGASKKSKTSKVCANDPQLAFAFNKPRALTLDFSNIALCYTKLDMPSCKNLLAAMIEAAREGANAAKSISLQTNDEKITFSQEKLESYAIAHIRAFGAFIYHFYALGGMSRGAFIKRFQEELLLY